MFLPVASTIAACTIAAWWITLAPAPPEPAPRDAPRWALEWDAPPSCPSREAVRARVDALAPRPRTPRSGLRVRGRVAVEAGRWILMLRVGDEATGSVRRMQAEDCGTLAGVLALITAIELDALATGATITESLDGPARPEPTRPVPEPPRSVSPPPERPDSGIGSGPVTASSTPPGPARRRAPGLGVALHAGAGFGGLPAWSPLLGGEVTVAWPRARLSVRGEDWPRQRLRYPGESAGASFELAAGSVRACPVLHPRPVELPLCVGVWIGGLRGVGRGIETSRAITDVWIAAELEPGLSWAPAPFVALRLGVAGLVMVRRPAFRLRDRPELFRAPPVGARVTLSLELRWRAERFSP